MKVSSQSSTSKKIRNSSKLFGSTQVAQNMARQELLNKSIDFGGAGKSSYGSNFRNTTTHQSLVFSKQFHGDGKVTEF
jgi:ABC-type transporter MlaC component